ncbi:MAG: hypothetical protein WDN44_05365 [Sphingomonas sp.]
MLAGLILAVATPARAQDALAQLDQLSRASAEAGPGIALARSQIGDGDLVAAAATLERVLITHPEADAALLLHASLLCRLDDPQGARTEIGELAGHPISGQAWAEVTAACGAIPRPSGRGGR